MHIHFKSLTASTFSPFSEPDCNRSSASTPQLKHRVADFWECQELATYRSGYFEGPLWGGFAGGQSRVVRGFTYSLGGGMASGDYVGPPKLENDSRGHCGPRPLLRDPRPVEALGQSSDARVIDHPLLQEKSKLDRKRGHRR